MKTANLLQQRTLLFYVSYGIFTDKRNSCLFLKQSMEILLRMNRNVSLKSSCSNWCLWPSSCM